LTPLASLPEGRPFDVVGVGLNAVDTLVVVPEYPRFNSKIEITGHLRSCGGQVATALVACRRWGLTAKYVGSIGEDEEGRFQRESLEREGIDLAELRVVPGAATQMAVIIVESRSGERTILWRRTRSGANRGRSGRGYRRDAFVDGHEMPLSGAAELGWQRMPWSSTSTRFATEAAISSRSSVPHQSGPSRRVSRESDQRDLPPGPGDPPALRLRRCRQRLALVGVARRPWRRCPRGHDRAATPHGGVFRAARGWDLPRRRFATAAAFNCTAYGARADRALELERWRIHRVEDVSGRRGAGIASLAVFTGTANRSWAWACRGVDPDDLARRFSKGRRLPADGASIR
jgi:hypothetical protein